MLLVLSGRQVLVALLACLLSCFLAFFWCLLFLLACLPACLPACLLLASGQTPSDRWLRPNDNPCEADSEGRANDPFLASGMQSPRLVCGPFAVNVGPFVGSVSK